MLLSFEIKGQAKAKQSVKIGRNGIKYTPKDMVEYANLVKLCFINTYPDWEPANFADKPLRMQIVIMMPIPKGFSKAKHERAIRGVIRPIVKPDCDNLAKNINDALNGIAYPDDKQIVDLIVNKYYAESPFSIVAISDEL